MSDERLRQLERRWRETGAVEDEAALLAHRLRVGSLSAGSLRLLAYLQHGAAMSVLLTECPKERLPRRELFGGPPDRIQQWVLGFADVCDPADRSRVAQRCFLALARAGLHAAGSDEEVEALPREHPWAVMLRPAGVCLRLVREGPDPATREARVRAVVRDDLVAWALGEPGTSADVPRPYSPGATFEPGEFVSHAKFGAGMVRRATGTQVEIEFECGSVRRLKHRPKERVPSAPEGPIERAGPEQQPPEDGSDQSSVLIERVRAGQLASTRVALAARLGHEAATLACLQVEIVEPWVPTDPGELFDAALELLEGSEQRRFASDCAERVVRFWATFAPHDSRPQEAIAAARRHADGRATDEELETARRAAEAAGWCTAINAADAAEAAKAAASRELGFARWAADVAVRVQARASAQSVEKPPMVPFQDVDFGPFDVAHRTAASAEREWQCRRLAAYVLRLVHPAGGMAADAAIVSVPRGMP
ncbi:MAG: hypothetical protein M9894_22850 [Planctomycetes bacterium]|nr:hypothetical protein [Planctomycetota bacterium]